jgi:hypothetical protein
VKRFASIDVKKRQSGMDNYYWNAKSKATERHAFTNRPVDYIERKNFYS